MSGLINCLHYPAPGVTRALLIMLPGAGIEAGEFAAQGMIAAVHAHNPTLDIIVAQPDMELYLEDGISSVLHDELVQPALARGLTRIWLLGISLGGMGALLYACRHQQHIEGIFLLAPFLGTRGTIAELTRAGGLPAWSAQNSAATIPEQRLLLWLQTQLIHTESRPALYLGYALQDRFAPAHRLLAQQLPPQRVATTPGGHDWQNWTSLWRALLARNPFTVSAGRCHEP